VFVSPHYAPDTAGYLTYAEPGDRGRRLALDGPEWPIGGSMASLEGLQVLAGHAKGSGGSSALRSPSATVGSCFLTVGDRQRSAPAKDRIKGGQDLRLSSSGKADLAIRWPEETGAASVPSSIAARYGKWQNPPSESAVQFEGSIRRHRRPGAEVIGRPTVGIRARRPIGGSGAPPRGGRRAETDSSRQKYGWPLDVYATKRQRCAIPSRIPGGSDQPVIYWTPLIATGTIQFYNGASFPAVARISLRAG